MTRAVDSGASPAAVEDAGREVSGRPEAAASREVLPAAQDVADAAGSPEAVRDAAYEAAARTSFPVSRRSPTLRASADVAYRAAEGEVLDEIAHLRYNTPAVVEELLKANPRLAPAPGRLQGGTLVDLPPRTAAPPAPAVLALGLNMTPAYRLVAGGEDVTERIRKYLDELRVTSSSERGSDTLELTVFDEVDRIIGVPGEARELHVFLGYGDRLTPMGIY